VQPDGSVTLIVGSTPGTSNDILARLVAPYLQQQLSQPVVDNRTGPAASSPPAPSLAPRWMGTACWCWAVLPAGVSPALMQRLRGQGMVTDGGTSATW
jgi:hypothetical protein